MQLMENKTTMTTVDIRKNVWFITGITSTDIKNNTNNTVDIMLQIFPILIFFSSVILTSA